MKKKLLARAIGAVTMALAAQQAFGAGFALQEQNGSGLGNAYAGGAASAEDASTVWSNPAGMSRFSTIQICGVGHGHLSPRPSSRTTVRWRHSASRSAATAAKAASRPRCPRCTSSCRSRRTGRSASASACRSVSRRDWDDGWLGRYQGAAKQDRDAQRQPVDLVADQRSVQPRRWRRLAAHQGDVHQQWQLFGGSCERCADRGRRWSDYARPGGGLHRSHARLRLVRQHLRRRRRMGMEHRRHVEPLAGYADRRALSLGDQVHASTATSTSETPPSPCRRRSRRSAGR